MAISAEQVRNLREKTGAGMMECKRALTESEGDMDRAIQLLRERGQAVAAKRQARQASEGLVTAAVSPEGNRGALIELNCETDFVARTDDFINLANTIADYALAHPETAVEQVTEDAAILDRFHELSAKLGEKLVLRRIHCLGGEADDVIATYIHTGGKIGVMVLGKVTDTGKREEARSLLREIAMHAAAARPEYLSRDDVPPEVLDREREIHETWARNQGRPETALPKIIQGRMDKLFYEAQVLMDQLHIRDQERTITQLVQQHPSGARLIEFVRITVGEE